MIIILILAAVLIIASLIGLFAVYHKTFYSRHKDMSETVSPDVIRNSRFGEEMASMINRICEKPCEFVNTKSFDGLNLSARYYEGDPDKALCICFHGYRGSAVRDFSAMGLYLTGEGYNVLLVDERAHWRSEGNTITYGIKERYDVLSWINYSNERFGSDKPIYIFGISMGGGTVLMASGLELPGNVRAILADCPYNSPKDVIKYVAGKVHLNPELSWPLIWMSAHIYGHFNVLETTAADEVKKTKTPILIIHGEGDDFVPAYMSKEVYDSNPDMIERYTFPEAGHGMSFFYDRERYLSIINEFMDKHR